MLQEMASTQRDHAPAPQGDHRVSGQERPAKRPAPSSHPRPRTRPFQFWDALVQNADLAFTVIQNLHPSTYFPLHQASPAFALFFDRELPYLAPAIVRRWSPRYSKYLPFFYNSVRHRYALVVAERGFSLGKGNAILGHDLTAAKLNELVRAAKQREADARTANLAVPVPTSVTTVSGRRRKRDAEDAEPPKRPGFPAYIDRYLNPALQLDVDVLPLPTYLTSWIDSLKIREITVKHICQRLYGYICFPKDAVFQVLLKLTFLFDEATSEDRVNLVGRADLFSTRDLELLSTYFCALDRAFLPYEVEFRDRYVVNHRKVLLAKDDISYTLHALRREYMYGSAAVIHQFDRLYQLGPGPETAEAIATAPYSIHEKIGDRMITAQQLMAPIRIAKSKVPKPWYVTEHRTLRPDEVVLAELVRRNVCPMLWVGSIWSSIAVNSPKRYQWAEPIPFQPGQMAYGRVRLNVHPEVSRRQDTIWDHPTPRTSLLNPDGVPVVINADMFKPYLLPGTSGWVNLSRAFPYFWLSRHAVPEAVESYREMMAILNRGGRDKGSVYADKKEPLGVGVKKVEAETELILDGLSEPTRPGHEFDRLRRMRQSRLGLVQTWDPAPRSDRPGPDFSVGFGAATGTASFAVAQARPGERVERGGMVLAPPTPAPAGTVGHGLFIDPNDDNNVNIVPPDPDELARRRRIRDVRLAMHDRAIRALVRSADEQRAWAAFLGTDPRFAGLVSTLRGGNFEIQGVDLSLMRGEDEDEDEEEEGEGGGGDGGGDAEELVEAEFEQALMGPGLDDELDGLDGMDWAARLGT